jgi:hypothetical protein
MAVNVVRSMFNILQLVIATSQCPRGLRHELSSLARKLRSRVRIPLKAWMSVFVRSFCVWVEALRGADPPSKELYRLGILSRN